MRSRGVSYLCKCSLSRKWCKIEMWLDRGVEHAVLSGTIVGDLKVILMPIVSLWCNYNIFRVIVTNQ